ncbi:hypothetical protein P8452_65870 [Trifolium repens]|nr:hypothetical protein P8452_65867 [Trifolium repens]WJX83192.1 hypothetical protein P8452_65870 [Trifolium repens]
MEFLAWSSILPYLDQYEKAQPNWKRSLGSAISGCLYRLLVIQNISIRFPQAIGEESASFVFFSEKIPVITNDRRNIVVAGILKEQVAFFLQMQNSKKNQGTCLPSQRMC